MILLDTHTFVWFFSNDSRLSSKAKRHIEKAKSEGSISVSAISIWEIFMLVKKEKLTLKFDVHKWLEIANKASYLRFVPVDNDIAGQSVILPGFTNPDPADRIIVATAQILHVPIVTKDQKMHAYKGITCIW